MTRIGRPQGERIKVECAGCGTDLEKRRSDYDRSKTKRFFCGRDCPGYAPKPRAGQERRCDHCNGVFYVSPSSTQRYCSNQCRFDDTAAERVDLICEGCGQVFQSTRHAARFCSMSCRFPERRMVTYVCMWCGEDFEAYVSTNQSANRFCRKEHFYEWQTANAKGSINSEGYVIISVNGVRKSEHRHVMEQIIGRPLLPEETVHHINGHRDDNNPSNLELWSKSHPAGQRVEDKIEWARELLDSYGYDTVARDDAVLPMLNKPKVKKLRRVRTT